MKRVAIVCGIAALLASCGGHQRPRVPDQVIDRALARAPGQAQPSTVVKRELEFARAVREQGKRAATDDFAAPGAIVHGADGPDDAAQLFAQLRGSGLPSRWEPRTVWMSCDGALAVSQGRFADAQGLVGNYVTVWERQPDRNYKWTYDIAAYDDPQPPPREPEPALGPADIVVTAIDSVKGLVAHCSRVGEEVPSAPAYAITDDASQGGKMSRDGTLRWRWEHQEFGERRIIVDWLTPGKWETGLDEALPASPE